MPTLDEGGAYGQKRREKLPNIHKVRRFKESTGSEQKPISLWGNRGWELELPGKGRKKKQSCGTLTQSYRILR